MRTAFSILWCVLACSLVVSQNSNQRTAAPSVAKPSQPAAEGTDTSWRPNTTDLLPEVQRNIGKNKTVAFIWWIPAEYFEASQPTATKEFDGFRENTVFAMAFAKIAPFGIMDFVGLDQIKTAVALRDASGTDYKPMENAPENVRVPLEMMKPVFAASIGKLGENIQFLIFPGKDRNGKRITDPKGSGDFTVLVSQLAGEPQTTVPWHLPLTAMFPPKFCPVGKERVEASWKFCPWHGVALPQIQ